MSYASWLSFIIIIIICIMYNDISYYMTEKKNIFDPNQIKFRTGDLLFFRWNDDSLISYNNLTKETTFDIKYLSNSIHKTLYRILVGYYTHVGMVVVIRGKPYVYETTHANTYTLPKFCMYQQKIVLNTPSLQDISCLQLYRGHVYHYKYLGKPFNMKKLNKYINMNVNNPISINFNSLITNVVPGCIYGTPSMTTCSGLISSCLVDQNIFKCDKPLCSTPGDIYKNCKNSKLYDDDYTVIKNNFSIIHQ